MKNETNIMVKNVVDVVLGGFTYWLFGYALSFGKSEWTNSFCGWGDFAINPDESDMGKTYTTFFFQLSFATTATTIVSGAIAERCVSVPEKFKFVEISCSVSLEINSLGENVLHSVKNEKISSY